MHFFGSAVLSTFWKRRVEHFLEGLKEKDLKKKGLKEKRT